MKASKIAIFGPIFLAAGLWATARATDISGDIWGTFSPLGNPYRVTGDLRVPRDSALFISPGCYLEFQGLFMLRVDTSAALVALGTETDSIVFTPLDTVTNWFGIYANAADSVVLSYCRLEHAQAEDELGPHRGRWINGAAVCCIETPLRVSHCRLSDNRAPIGDGGAIYCTEAEAIIENNLIVRNRADWAGLGGGIAVRYGQFRIDGNTIADNIAFNLMGGGGVYCGLSSGVISNNEVDGNYAPYFAGGLSIVRSRVEIVGNRIVRNLSYYSGAVDISDSSSVALKNNIIAENHTENGQYYNGGTIFSWFSHFYAINNIIYDNRASAAACLRIYQDMNDTIANCIFWGNSSIQGTNIIIDGLPPLFFYCDIQGGWPGVGNIDVDPLFRDPAGGDFHLMSTACGDAVNSPCIDAGHPFLGDDSLSCAWGLGTVRSDMGAYGGGTPIVGIDDEDAEIPTEFSLSPPYPNPFNAQTTIEYALPRATTVSLAVYDITGRAVATIAQGIYTAGYYRKTWDAKGLASGLYFVRLQAGEYREIMKMMLLK